MSAGNFGSGIVLPFTVDDTGVDSAFARLLQKYQAVRAELQKPIALTVQEAQGPTVFGANAGARAADLTSGGLAWRGVPVSFSGGATGGAIQFAPSITGAAAGSVGAWRAASGPATVTPPAATTTALTEAAPSATQVEALTSPGRERMGMVQRMATRFALLYAAHEAIRITNAGIEERHDLALAGSDSRAQFAAIEKWNQSASVLGPIGLSMAETVQGRLAGRNVSVTGTDLVMQSADIQDKRTAMIYQSAVQRQRAQNELATFSTIDPVQRQRIEVRGEAALERDRIIEHRREQGQLDAQDISNRKEQYKEEYRENFSRKFGPLAGLARHLLPDWAVDTYANIKTAGEGDRLAALRDAEAKKALGLSASLETARIHDIDRQDANRDQMVMLKLAGRKRELKDDIAHPRNPIFGNIDSTLTSGEEEILGFLQAGKTTFADKARDNLLLQLRASQKQWQSSFKGGSIGYGELGMLTSANTAEDPAEIFKKFGQAQREAQNYNPSVNSPEFKIDPESAKRLARDIADALGSLIGN